MTSGRILVVEDDLEEASVVTEGLRTRGFAVAQATDGGAAIELLRSGEFDVVLSDVAMPDIDGYELCRRIKVESADQPVVLLTSLDDPIEVIRALDAGADYFLRKPIDVDQLVGRLHAVLPHSQVRGSDDESEDAEVTVDDTTFLITAERQQILDLLVASYEELVATNRQLQEQQLALESADDRLRTQLRATEEEKRRLEAVLDAAPQAVAIVDTGGVVTDVSDTMCSLLGRRRHEIVGRHATEVFRYVDAVGEPIDVTIEMLISSLLQGNDMEIGGSFDVFLQRDDQRVPVMGRAAPVRGADGEPIALVGVLADLGGLSAYDTVTRLPHQASFADHVTRVVTANGGSDGRAAVMAVALDGFSWLVRNLDPADMEFLLAAVADRIRRALADPEVCTPRAGAAHFGNGTFGVVLDGLDDEFDALRRAQLIADAIGTDAVPVGNHSLPTTVAVGVALHDERGDDAVDLISGAVLAARRASSSGARNRIEMADESLDRRAGKWLRRQDELRDAIERDQLVVHYQPEVDLRSGRIWGVEALVRWSHPERGLLFPGDFLPLAEQTGLLASLGWWVLREACRQTAEWRADLPSAGDLRVAVNVDASQLMDPDVAQRVRDVLVETGLASSALLLEVTESGVLEDHEQVAERLREIKALGVSTAIDDFGTGYSSLRQLQLLPIDHLKIDRSFVATMVEDPDASTIVAATVRLAHGLGLEAVAEGAETDDQVERLRLLDCDYAQGYLWSRPLPPSDLETWLAGWRPSAAFRVDVDRHDADEPGSTAVDDVVAYLVHELQAPLDLIATYADFALHGGEMETREYLEPIRRVARDLEQRISTVADLPNMGARSLRLRRQEIELTAALRSLRDDLAPQVRPHPVTVTGDEEVVVHGDATRLAQAVTNLIMNAARHSAPDAPIELSVRPADGVAILTVRDHGPGVSADRRADLFRPPAPGRGRTSSPTVGLGLVRTIARAHGGDVRYEPAEGGGACFTLVLPREQVPSPST